MPPRKKETPLEELNPAGMEPTRENIALARRVLIKLHNMQLAWSGTLTAWEKHLGQEPAVIREPKGNPRPNPNGVPTKNLVLVKGSMAEAAWNIISAAPRPMTFSELGDELSKLGFSKSVSNGRRAHYGVVQRFREQGHIVTHKGRITTAANLKRYLDDVAAGRAEDVFAFESRGTWAAPVLSAFALFPEGATVQEMLDHLATEPKYAAQMSKINRTYFFGLVNRLWRKEKLIEMCGNRGKSAVYKVVKRSDADHQHEKMRATEDSPSAARH